MANLKDIHHLVHGLSKAELRYIKLFIDSHAGKSKERYKKQIHILLNSKKFDKNVLKNNMKNIGVKRLSEFNTNLFSFISRGLVSLELNQSTNYKIQFWNLQADILKRKGLVERAEKILKKTINHYQNYGFDELLIQSHKQHYKILLSQHVSFDKLIQSTDEKIALLKNNINETAYLKLNYEMNQLFSKYYIPRTKEQAKVYYDFLSKELMQDVRNAKSNYAKHFYYMIKVPALFMVSKFDEALTLSEEAISFTEQSFDVKIDPIPLLFQLRRYLNSQISIARIGKIDETIGQLENLISQFPNKFNELNLWSTIVDAKITKYIELKAYDEGVAYFEQNAKEKYGKDFENVPRIDAKAMLIARLYFLAGDNEESLKYCALAQEGNQFKFSSSIISVKFLELMNHIKLKNNLLVPHVATSLKRFLEKEEKLYGPEKAMLQFCRKINDVNRLDKHFKKLYHKLQEEKNNPFNFAFFDAADYLKWIEDEIN